MIPEISLYVIDCIGFEEKQKMRPKQLLKVLITFIFHFGIIAYWDRCKEWF
jgi:hypothetical protein